jgi:hypothetical protein
MKSLQWTNGTRAVALTFALAAAVGCGERLSDTSTKAPQPLTASPSAVVIGTAPAEPQAQADTAQTTSPSGAQGELSKREESVERPKEGDNHSYSTLDPTSPQKAQNVDSQQVPERKQP